MVGDSSSVVGNYFVVSSLLLVFISLFGGSPKWRKWRIHLRPITNDSPYLLWKGIASGVILAVILILCLVLVNSMKGAVGRASINIALLVLLAGDLAILWDVVKRLRQRRN